MENYRQSNRSVLRKSDRATSDIRNSVCGQFDGTFLWASASKIRLENSANQPARASQSNPPIWWRTYPATVFWPVSNFFSVAEPKKEKTEQNANGAISPSGGGEPQAANLGTTGSAMPVPGPAPDAGDQQKPNRPNTLDARVVARRLILFDSEYTLASMRLYSRIVIAQRKVRPLRRSLYRQEACVNRNKRFYDERWNNGGWSGE